MDTRVAKIEERLDDHDREIRDTKQRVSTVETQTTRLDKDIAIILNDNGHMRDSLVKIEAGISELRAKREDDHYVKPLSKHEARGEQMYRWIIGGFVGALVGAIATALLTNLAF